MTYVEFGLQLRQIFPHLVQVPLNNEDLAQYFLNLYPQYYDAISPTARRIKEISERRPESSAWFESSRVQNVAGMIANNRAEAMALHEMDMLVKASGMGVPVTALHDIAVNTHQTNETIRLEQFRRDNGLDGADRTRLTPHNLIQQLEDRLMRLIDRRDAESHPDKREVLSTRIKHLQEELNARGQQAVVSAGGGTGLRQPDEDTDGPGGSQPSQKGDVEPVPREKSRVGF